jgi:hypothetical protein
MPFHRKPGIPKELRAAMQEKFAQLIVAGSRPHDAYRKAGYTARNDNVAHVSATKLLQRVGPRISEIIGVGNARTVAEKTLKEFQQDVPWARAELHKLVDDPNCPHSVKLGAIKECLNRGLGLPVQYVEQNVNVRYQISDRELTEAEWEAKYITVEPIKPVN